MQAPSQVQCQTASCKYTWTINSDGGAFSALLDDTTDSSYAYAIVTCPKCHTRLFHCKMCLYNTSRKNHITRHLQSHHETAAAPTTASVEATEDHSSASDVDFGSNNDVDMDTMSDDGSIIIDDDAMEIDEDELEDLPPYEPAVMPPSDQADVDQDEFLRSLVAEEVGDANVDVSPSLLFDYVLLNPHGLLPVESFGMFGDNMKSKLYYWQNDIHRKLSNGKNLLGGIMSITWCAINQIFSYGIDDVIPLPDTNLMFNMLEHALANKGEQKRNFFDILSNVYSRIPTTITSFIASLGQDAKDQCDAFSSSLSSEQLHTFNNLCNLSSTSTLQQRLSKKDEGDANAMLLKGKYAMIRGLPTPNVYIEEKSGHAYVNISDVIDHAVADGLGILQLQDQYGNTNSYTINGSAAGAELLQRLRSGVSDPDNTAFGAVILWSDGFCRTYVKQKDNSVWILTLTFLNTDKKTKSSMHTYCIAIGKSSEDHTPVLEIIMKQLEGLQHERTRYCGITGTFIKTSFGVIAYSTDRIERCFVMNTSQLGIFGQRSHWACAIDPTTLPMCTRCFKRLMSTLQTSPFPLLEVLTEPGNVCQECCQWDCDMALGPLPEHYPTVSNDGDDSPTPPKNRTADETQHVPMLQTFQWLQQGLLYSFHNATTSTRSQRWRRQNINPYLKSMGMGGKVIDAVWESAKHKNKYPNTATINFMPYLWTIGDVLPMERFINSPMHLLFHGVVDDVMKLVHKFMAKYKKLETFERFVNVHLLEIEMFRLDWCKLRKLPKAFWLAEDILGFCRIMPCIYGIFFANNFKFGRSSSSSRFVKSCSSVQLLLNSLHVMISTLMNPRTSTDVKKIDSYIKVFLSCGHQASKWIEGKGESFWMDRGNHLSLLNLPAQILRFGPVRWYWEGVSEAFIHDVKPHLIESMRKSATYFRDKLVLIYKLRCMAFIKLRMKGSTMEEDRTSRSKGFYRYASLAEVETSFQLGMPISAFIFQDGFVPREKCLVWVAFGRGVNTQLVPIQYSADTNSVQLCGMPFMDCELLSNNVYSEKFDTVKDKISSYCVLLPHIVNHVNTEQPAFDRKYAFIYDDWDILTSSGIKEEVLLSRQLFLAEDNI